MVFIPKPTDLKDWVMFGNFVRSELKYYKENIWDEKENKYFIEIEHTPSELMMFEHQIDYSKEKDYDRAKHVLKSRFPMEYVLDIKGRIGGGTYILMLCDYKGNQQKIIERIDKRMLSQMDSLRKELTTAKANLIRVVVSAKQLAKHPEEFWESLLQKQKKALESSSVVITQQREETEQ